MHVFVVYLYASKEGFGQLAIWCANHGLPLFRLRPKVHMQMHIQYLDWFGMIFLCSLRYCLTAFSKSTAPLARLDVQHQLESDATFIFNSMSPWVSILSMVFECPFTIYMLARCGP